MFYTKPYMNSNHSNAHEPLLKLLRRHLQIHTFGGSWQRHRHGYNMKARTLTRHNLIYVMQGRVTWVINGQSFPLKPNDLLIVPPYQRHHAVGQTQRVNLGSFHLSATLPGGRDVFAWLGLPAVRKVTRDNRLDRMLRLAVEMFENPHQGLMELMHGWGELLMQTLIRYDAEQGLLEPQPLDPIVANILEQLQDRLADPPTLEELGEVSGYSAQHLNRLFKQTVGVTPLQYLLRLRMDRAAQLLVDGQWTVAAVGQAVGYDSPFYFSRVFRKHFGLSPSQYQQTACSESAGSDSA